MKWIFIETAIAMMIILGAVSMYDNHQASIAEPEALQTTAIPDAVTVEAAVWFIKQAQKDKIIQHIQYTQGGYQCVDFVKVSGAYWDTLSQEERVKFINVVYLYSRYNADILNKEVYAAPFHIIDMNGAKLARYWDLTNEIDFDP